MIDLKQRIIDDLTVDHRKKNIKEIWGEVFPDSLISVRSCVFGDPVLYIAGYLAKDKTECNNGYIDNDPLRYFWILDADGTYRENRLYLHIKPPEGSRLAYSSAKMRKKTIKNVTYAKLRDRLEQIRQFIIDNRERWVDDLEFSLAEKVGV